MASPLLGSRPRPSGIRQVVLEPLGRPQTKPKPDLWLARRIRRPWGFGKLFMWWWRQREEGQKRVECARLDPPPREPAASSHQKCPSCCREALKCLHGLLGTAVHHDELLTIYRSPALGGAAAERLHPQDRFLPSGSFQDEAVNPGLKHDGMKRERGSGQRREHVSALVTRRHPVSLHGPGRPGSGEQILKRQEQQRLAKGNKQSHSGKVNGQVWPTGNDASGGSPEQGGQCMVAGREGTTQQYRDKRWALLGLSVIQC